MTKLRFEVILFIAGIAVIALIALTSGAPPKQPPSVFSSYDTGPNGYRALYEVLRAAGVPVTRFESPLDILAPSVRTLILTGYENDPSAIALDEHDALSLRRFVENGGRLVAIDAEFAGSADVTPGVGTTLRNGGGRDAIALARNAYTLGVRRVTGAIDWIFPFATPRGVPLLASGQGIVALAYRFGRGEVIAVTAPALFGNAHLRSAGNLRFAYNAIAGAGPVAFDEYVHGYSDTPSLWSVLPATVRAAAWVAVAIALLALIGANVPFAPPYRAARDDERDSSDYITAVAELLRRSRKRAAGDDVVRQAALDFRTRKGLA
ncbi:MAG: DUF4350 domain-containing protein [Candidatus Eremiobacteraeota bacterium]|nr:DUF4350 domain-containing protein [Candidatus Eremiobacteraeota bacterium]MBV9057390.1 DUF4350 domain-containing protein [Candidatus Eremiobacteraeota bacterium]